MASPTDASSKAALNMWIKKLAIELKEVRAAPSTFYKRKLTLVYYRTASPPSSTAPDSSRPTSRADSTAPASSSLRMLVLKREFWDFPKSIKDLSEPFFFCSIANIFTKVTPEWNGRFFDVDGSEAKW